MGGPHSDPAFTTSEPHIRVLKILILLASIFGIISSIDTLATYGFYLNITDSGFFKYSDSENKGQSIGILILGCFVLILSLLMIIFGYRAIQFATLMLFGFLASFICIAISFTPCISFKSSNCDQLANNLIDYIIGNWSTMPNDLKTFLNNHQVTDIEMLNVSMIDLVDNKTCKPFYIPTIINVVLQCLCAVGYISLLVMMRAFPNKIGVYTDCCIESSNVFGVDYYKSAKK